MNLWVNELTSAVSPFRFILISSRPYWRYAIGSSICVIIAAAIDAFAPFVFKQIVDIVTAQGGKAVDDALLWAGAYVVFNIISAPLFWRGSGLIGMKWTVGVRATATDVLTAYATKHSADYFSKRFAGSIGSKISNASNAAKTMCENYLWSYLNLFISIGMTLFLIFNTYLWLGALFILWIAVATPLNVVLAKRRVPLSIVAQEEDTKLRGRVIDLITNIGAMRDFARRALEMRLLRGSIIARYQAGISNWRAGEFNRIANNLLQGFFAGSMTALALYLWSQEVITPGDVILILTLVNSISDRFETLGRNFNELAEKWGEIREGLEDVLKPHVVNDSPYAKPLVVSEGKVSFASVAFTYEDRPIFKKLSFDVFARQKVGLVGHSGAGKSTLVKILMRQYDIGKGSISIDGQDISSVTQDSLRQAISVVPQEPMLFHRTIRENIAYGNPKASRDDIEEAARLAQAHDFIKRLSNGYDTLVGERGVKLSGGERQRVAIARAILKNAPILILDEATSSLDSESEVAIQKALHVLMEGKTVIAIAHRLSTLREMDRVLVLDGGEVIEDGPHDTLIKKRKGVYAGLWKHQSGGYLKE